MAKSLGPDACAAGVAVNSGWQRRVQAVVIWHTMCMSEKSRANDYTFGNADVHLPDGSVSPVFVFPAQGNARDEDKPLVAIWPGFGMGAKYFRPTAQELADRGYPVVIGELRGQGRSKAKASRRARWGYHDTASQDYPETIRAAKEELGLPQDYPTVLLVHSMGGQVGSLFLARPEAKELNVVGMMGVGAGSPYKEGFVGADRRRVAIGSLFMTAVSKVFGFWPAGRFDLAGYGRQSGVHVQEWARFAHTNSLANLRGQDIDYEAQMKEVSVPILLNRFTNDDDCTLASAAYLADKFNPDIVRVEQLIGGLGHTKWARKPERVADKLDQFTASL